MSFDRRLRALCASALTGLMLAALPAAARAQTTSASVSGSVQDAQGGALPGVAVTLTSRTQGNTATAVTDAEGRFVFAIVRPDTYTLSAELQGFKKLERTNLVVNANDRLSAGILALEVGAMTEEVTVSTRVSELQTTSGERSFTLENSALQNIANNGRALFNFATLVPGAVPNANGGGEIMQVSGFTVNGQRANSNTMAIDGVANIDTGDNGGNMATTNIDAVAEFKVLTNAYQAEYGRAVGAQLQVVTKSGSRDFHGSGYWYGRRSDWNANSWINNRNTPVTPKADTKRNDSGYTVGGPIFAPGFNADKKKLFFFFSQEHQKRVENNAIRETRVPTALERRGDFSQSRDNNGNLYPYIRDYTTGLPCTRREYQRLLPGRRRGRPHPGQPPLRARPRGPRHLPGCRTPPGSAPTSTTRARRRTTRRAVRTCSAWTTRRRTTGASPAATCTRRKTSSRPTARPGPATAATSSRRRRSSCTPATTT